MDFEDDKNSKELSSKKILSITGDVIKDIFLGALNLVEKYADSNMKWIQYNSRTVRDTKELKFFFKNKKTCHIIKQRIVSVYNNDRTYIVTGNVFLKTSEICQSQESYNVTVYWHYVNEWKIVFFEVNKSDIGTDKSIKIDSLTHIYNLEGFCERASEIIHLYPQYHYAVIKMGAKDFRHFNRKYGFKTGDILLKVMAQVMKEFCHSYETCGRIEKDYFALFIRIEADEGNQNRLNQLLSNLNQSILENKLSPQINFKLGVYVPQNLLNEDIHSMLDKAWIAMKNSKIRDQKNYTIYKPAMIETQENDFHLLEIADKAFQEQEFRPYIQPLINLIDNTIVGGELLVRWFHKNKLIMPNQFISLFESNGLAYDLDCYMLNQLCSILKDWIDENEDIFPISINQTRTNIYEEKYIEKFNQTVNIYQIPHHYIIFELTESTFANNKEYMKKITDQLHNYGYLIAIDDFGTGYTSLDILSEIPADILKVDKCLLANYETNTKTRLLLEKVIDLAHSLGMKVVCEGIETQEQLELLQALECDIGQGFIVSHAKTPSDFLTFVKRGWKNEKNKESM